VSAEPTAPLNRISKLNDSAVPLLATDDGPAESRADDDSTGLATTAGTEADPAGVAEVLIPSVAASEASVKMDSVERPTELAFLALAYGDASAGAIGVTLAPIAGAYILSLARQLDTPEMSGLPAASEGAIVTKPGLPAVPTITKLP
jgi:hypothetical protein